MRLPAAGPQEWARTHLLAFQRRWDAPGSAMPQERHGMDDVPDVLAAGHARYVAEGASRQAAAKWVVGEHVGNLASVLAWTWVGAGAVHLDVRDARFGRHADGWVQYVDLGPRVAVGPDHPWAGLDDVEVLPDAAALRARLVEELRSVGDPVIAAGRRLARVGVRAHWAEVADYLGSCTEHAPGLETTPEVVAELEAVLAVPGAPWRTRPDLWFADTADGPVPVHRKGGCCLAYLGEPSVTEDLDHRTAAYREAFPPARDPDYCSTCCFRDRDDVQARLLWSAAYETAAPAD